MSELIGGLAATMRSILGDIMRRSIRCHYEGDWFKKGMLNALTKDRIPWPSRYAKIIETLPRLVAHVRGAQQGETRRLADVGGPLLVAAR